MRIKPMAFGILTIALFAGTVGITMAAGAWQSTGRTAAGAGAGGGGSAATGQGTGAGGGATPGSASGAAGGADRVGGTTSSGGTGTAGSAVIGDIKGWMTIGDVATTAGVSLPEILAAFALPADTPPTTAVKDLESDVFSVTALRTWLAARGGPDAPVADPAPQRSVAPGSSATP